MHCTGSHGNGQILNPDGGAYMDSFTATLSRSGTTQAPNEYENAIGEKRQEEETELERVRRSLLVQHAQAVPEVPVKAQAGAVRKAGPKEVRQRENRTEIIGAPGFEPGTSPTRTVRATRLRHAPRVGDYPRPGAEGYSTASIAASIRARLGPSWSVRVPFGPLTIAAWRVRMPRSLPSSS